MGRQFQPGRAIEVIAPKYGSGYQIGGRLALTAKHLLGEVGSDCRIRAKQSFGEVNAKVVWKAENADIALVELPESVPAVEPVVFGLLPDGKTGEKLPFQMYGYPLWAQTKRDEGKSAAGGRQIEGIIYLADRSPDGLLVLEAQRLPPEATISESEWAGASGGAIVCDGLVVAVQSQHQNPNRPASLEAAPLWQVYEDEGWCELLERHGVNAEPAMAAIAQKRNEGDTFNFENAGAMIGNQIGKAEAGSTIINVIQRHYYSPVLPDQVIPAPYYYPCDLGSTTFVGRSNELAQLHQLLQTSQRVGIVAITGMGGIGKTQLAWQYVELHRRDYPGGIWWLSVSQLVSEVLRYGRRTQLREAPNTLESNVARVQWYYDRWLEAIPDGMRLLVWDDVIEYGAGKSFLPQDGRYRVLLTTRAMLGSPVQRFELGVLKPEDALELLRRLVGNCDRVDGEQESAQALCEWLGYLPLGIELVGRHLAGCPMLKLETLLERLKEKRLQTRALQQVPSEMPYQENLEAAFELSWQLLDETAKRLGCLLSVFALAPIHREWVVSSLPTWDDEEVEESTMALARWSLVGLKDGQYLLHTLIREFFAQKLQTEMATEAEKLQRSMAEAMVAEAKTVPQTVTLVELARVQGAVPHWQVVADELTSLLEEENVDWTFIALGRVAVRQNRWQDAERCYQACLTMSEERFGKEHTLTALSLNNLAELYSLMGRCEEALPLVERALAIQECKLEEYHCDIARSLQNLANLFYVKELYQDALLLVERALAIRERKLGASHPDTAQCLNSMAILYDSMRRYGEALPLYERALTIREQTLGASHPDTISSLNNLAGLYRKTRRYLDALQLYKRALEIVERELGASHIDTAGSLNNLAVLYQTMGCYREAEDLYHRAISIWMEALGEFHSNTQTGIENFRLLIEQVMNSDRVGELSDHSFTQATLRDLGGIN